MIKVCINPQCEEIAHNIDKNEKHCRNCDFIMVEINKDTYLKKFINNPFQYDYSNDSGKIVTPADMGYDLQTELILV